jgi:hypothetical protein
MVATAVALLVQVNVTPLIALPLLSCAVAVNCCVAPTAIEGDAGETAMLATVDDPPDFEPEPLQPIDHDSSAIKPRLRARFRTGQRLITFTPFSFGGSGSW